MARHVKPNRVSRWLRFKALLAGGLLLSVGGTMTLASWTDNEYAVGTFSASSFDIQGSVDGGTTWTDHPVGSPATMAFGGAAMSPSSAAQYAGLLIRTKAGSINGTLALGGGSASGTSAALFSTGLQYRVVTFSGSGTCAAASFNGSPTYLVGSSGPVAITTTPIPTVAVAANGTAITQLCFEVSMSASASNSLQGQSTTVTWQVTGTSS